MSCFRATKRNENKMKANQSNALTPVVCRMVAEAAVCGGAGARLCGGWRAGLRHR